MSWFAGPGVKHSDCRGWMSTAITSSISGPVEPQFGTRRPSESRCVAADPDVAVSGAKARIVLPTRLLLPVVHTHEHAEPLNERLTKPTVLCLWSETCAPCLKELEELAHHADRLKQAGLDVVAINLDQLDGPEQGSDPLAHLKFPFRSEHAALGLVKSLDAFQKAMFDLWQDLAVPATILVDDQPTSRSDLPWWRWDRPTLVRHGYPGRAS